jgi:hypothetical protein
MVTMKNGLLRVGVVGMIFLIWANCVEPYEPPTVENGRGILVVEGSLNTSGKSTIRLTRTQDLSETTKVNVELKAIVSFEDEGGTVFLLKEEGGGSYTLPAQSFDHTKHYRLAIKTSDLKEYASAYVPVVNTPAIDSVSWRVTSDNGVQVYISTHDPENKTRYFRWDYEETWSYVSAFNSRFTWLNGKPVLRSDNIYNCYRTQPSGNIEIGSTASLNQAVISNFPLVYMAQRSEKIRFKYSVLVRQYGITKEASQLTGNITSLSDASEPILGYFTAESVNEKRIFISSDVLPRASTYITPFDGCSADTLTVQTIPLLRAKDLPNIILLESLPSGPGAITAYSASTPACADCRSVGGTTTKPDFWK